MTTKTTGAAELPEALALRLADDLEASSHFPGNMRSCNNAAAAELRRLHALLNEQQRTIEALNACINGEGSTTTENLRLVDRLHADNELLRKHAAKQISDSNLLTGISFSNGGMNIGLEGGACQLLVESFFDQFIESGAVNFLEMRFESHTKMPGKAMTVTLQLADGLTPGQKIAAANTRIAELEAENEALRAQPAGAATPAAPAPGVPRDQLPSFVIQLQEMWDALEKKESATTTDLRRWSKALSQVEHALAAPQPPAAVQEPIDMVLHCPKCGLQHIDAPEEVPGMPILKSAATPEHPHRMVQVGTYTGQGEWKNPPHRSHLCHGCGHIWRPADVPTNGVQVVKTKGKADSPIATPQPAVTAGAVDAPKPGERCQWCVDRHDGFYGSYAPECPHHDDDGKPRATHQGDQP